MYLTDEQYLDILYKIRMRVGSLGFRPSAFDSAFPGDKYTESNCGFCCGEFVTEETALFPEQFPERRSMKYRLDAHKCPFDMRETPDVLGWGWGCFSECYVFHCHPPDVQLMRTLVANRIKEVEDG